MAIAYSFLAGLIFHNAMPFLFQFFFFYMEISRKNRKRKGIALSLNLWRLEQEISLQAPCTNFWDKMESIGEIEAKVWNASEK